MANIEMRLLEFLETLSSSTVAQPFPEQIASKLIKDILYYIKVPEFLQNEDIPRTYEDYKVTTKDSIKYIKYLGRILEELISIKACNKSKISLDVKSHVPISDQCIKSDELGVKSQCVPIEEVFQDASKSKKQIKTDKLNIESQNAVIKEQDIKSKNPSIPEQEIQSINTSLSEQDIKAKNTTRTHQDIKSQNLFISDQFIKSNTLDILFTISQHALDEFEWSSINSTEATKPILELVISLCECHNMESLLLGDNYENKDGISDGNSYFTNGVTTPYLQLLSKNFTKKHWKKYPGLKGSYFWILNELKSPYLRDYVGYVLPPALMLIDDWEPSNKIIGLRSLYHILTNNAKSELRWYGRANVIYDAVKNMIYTKELTVLEWAYFTLLQAIDTLESDPSRKNRISVSLYDETIERLLLDMSHEDKLKLRSFYIKTLQQIIHKMDIKIIRWSEPILEICENYASTYEGPLAQDRIQTVKVLKDFILKSEGQIKYHINTIMKIILRLLFDIQQDSPKVDPKAILTLQKESKELVKVLMFQVPEQMKEQCVCLSDIKLNIKIDNDIKDIVNIINNFDE